MKSKVTVILLEAKILIGSKFLVFYFVQLGLFIYLLVYLFICLFVCLFIYLYSFIFCLSILTIYKSHVLSKESEYVNVS